MFNKIIRKIQSIKLNNRKDKILKDDGKLSYYTKDREEIKFNSKGYETLNGEIELSDIPDVFQLLFSNDENVKLKSAETLNCIMNSLDSAQLIKVEKIFRNRNSYGYSYDFRYKEPKDLLNTLMSDEEKVTILGLCSFHCNGYFREKSVKALASIETGYEIPYLLIRLKDWVSVIRETSRKELLKYINLQYAVNFTNNLYLIFKLEENTRYKNSHITNSVISLLSSDEGAKSLIYGLKSDDQKVRLYCYNILLEKGILDLKSIINYLIKDKIAYNRLFIIRKIMKDINDDEFISIIELLLNDKLDKIRIIAIERMYELGLDGSIELLEKSLFDNNKSVRETARYLLSKHKKYSFDNIYRISIEKNQQLYSSICGLGETGNRKDSKLISGFLSSDNIKIVKATIKAIAELDLIEYKEKLILMLSDEKIGVSKAAKRVLNKEVNSFDGKDIYSIFKSSTYEHVRINTCNLLSSLSKWDSLKYIIEFCDDSNKNISNIGQEGIRRWKEKYNSSFTSPNINQIQEIRKSIIYFGDSLKKSDKAFIEYLIKDK